MAKGAIAHLAQRYGAVIFFPSFAFGTIFADWSHTRNWKLQQQQKLQREELLKQR